MKLLICHLAEFRRLGDERRMWELCLLSILIGDMKNSLGLQDLWVLSLMGKRLSMLGKLHNVHPITKPNFSVF